MKKKLVYLSLLLLIIGSLNGCSKQCKHETVTVATCTKGAICLDCGQEISPALGHSNLTHATCESASICGVCGESVGSPLGHNYQEQERVEPTCLKEGYSRVLCTTCGQEKINTLEKIDHDWSEYVVKDATCAKEGSKTRTCAACGEKEAIVLEKLDHTWSDYVIKDSTCAKNGSKTRTCTVCGEKEVIVLEKVDHEFGEYKVTKEATLTKAGVMTRKCKHCGKKETMSYELDEDEKAEYRAKNLIPAKNMGTNLSEALVVNKLAFKKKIGGTYFYTKPSNGVYFAVTFRFYNNGSSTTSVSYNDFELIVDGNEYDASYDAAFYASKALIYEDIQPGCSKKLTVYFDIPKSVAKNPDATFFYDGALWDNIETHLYLKED